MNALFTVLTVLVLLASVLITLIVLLQNGKGGGLASNFTAGNQTFGVRQTTDILEKITWGLVIFIFVVSVATTFSLGNKASEVDYTDKLETEAAAPVFPEAVQDAEAPTVE
jgi:preprotein translocase subunit SecG